MTDITPCDQVKSYFKYIYRPTKHYRKLWGLSFIVLPTKYIPAYYLICKKGSKGAEGSNFGKNGRIFSRFGNNCEK